jgi:putative glutamine amidotransferase
MSRNASPLRIGIYGWDEAQHAARSRAGLWPSGYTAALTTAGAEPVGLGKVTVSTSWDKLLKGLHGLVLAGSATPDGRHGFREEQLCEWCRKQRLPLLGVDYGLHVLNLAYGGNLYHDLARELPEALQHRHPPEAGLRHAIHVECGTRLAGLYGEGEVIVNSEHRRAVQRVARGFRVAARALDGVIEAIESEADNWFAIGVQWHPASASASGLDIQLFRGLVDACQQRWGARKEVCAAA